MMKKVPFLYSYIHSKLLEYGNKGKINVHEFKWFIGSAMRIKKEYSLILLKEMEEMKLIRLDRRTNTITLL